MGKIKAPSNKHSLESSVRELGEELGKSVREQSSDFGKDFFNQLLNINFGDKAKNQPEYAPSPKDNSPVVFDAANHRQHDKKRNAATEKYLQPKPKEERRAAIDYAREVLEVGEKAGRKHEQTTIQTIQELIGELRRLADSSKVLQMEFASVAVEQTSTKVGEYHVNFFEWMLIVVRAAREKVEDSGAWLSAMKGKNGKKNGYWGMFKKHGTTFGLSNERVVATQTG